MPAFLSDEWIAAFDELLHQRSAGRDDDADDDAAADPLVIGHTVTGGPGGATLEYHVVVADRERRVRRGRPASPTVEFVCDYATAVAVSRGAVPAQTVFLDGRLRVSGDTAALLDGRDVLDRLGEVADALRADTTYPPVPNGIERHA
jgi:hypothetical protein